MVVQQAHKFAYINPASNLGYSALDLAGGSALLGFDRSLMLGYAKNFYGILFNIEPNWICSNKSDGYECKANNNQIGVNFSVPLGGSVFYAYAGRWTSDIERDDWFLIYSKDNTEDTIYYHDEYEFFVRKAHIGITGGNALVWDLRLAFDYYDVSAFFNSSHATYREYYTKFLFDFGYKILHSDRVKFIAGLNNEISWLYTNEYNQKNNLYFNISPNFLGEVVLTKHLLAFAGARHGIYLKTELPEEHYFDIEAKAYQITNSGSSAYVGLRYECENWAVETRLQSDAFGEILSGNNPFISLGGFIWM